LVDYTRNIFEGSTGAGYLSSGYTTTGYITSGRGLIVVEAIARSQGFTRSLSQTVTLTEQIKRGIDRVITQTMTIIEAINRVCQFTRILQQGTGGYTSSGYTESGYVVENLTEITETLTKVRNVPRTLTEILDINETLDKVFGAVRDIAQTVTGTEALLRRLAATRTITPVVTIIGSVARISGFLRTITQSLDINEILRALQRTPQQGAKVAKQAIAYLLKRSGVTRIFKRSADTVSI